MKQYNRSKNHINDLINNWITKENPECKDSSSKNKVTNVMSGDHREWRSP